MRAQAFTFILLAYIALAMVGCHSNPGVSCPRSTVVETWLDSEVKDKFTDDYLMRFPLQNHDSSNTTIRIKAIGCSCYKVSHDGKSVKVGSTFEIPALGETTVDLRPPAAPKGDSVRMRMVVEAVPKTGNSVDFEFSGEMRVILDLRTDSSILIQEFPEETTSQMARLEITRHARTRKEVDELPQITGWPEGTSSIVVEPLGEATEDQGIWKKTFRASASVPRPDFQFSPEIRSILSVEVPNHSTQIQLVQRLRTGLSGPKMIHFGSIKSGKTVARRILISSQDDIPFCVQGLEAADSHVHFKADSADPAKSQWLELTFSSDEAGAIAQKLQVRTTHPKHPLFDLEIRANVAH